MGMSLYESSAVARAIWDRADEHFLSNYGVSILDIVRNNPKAKTVHFGGAKGQAIRRNYINMTYDVMDSQGQIKTLSLFPEVTETTSFYTFHAPNGLLFATQFTQPALTLMERAGFEDMKSRGLIQQSACFAGHSLGEYAALAAIGDLPLEKLVDVVFYRGMTMQAAVERDAQGRSNYGMCAINPSRVGKNFSQTALAYVVDTIAHQSGGLLEIVNYNVENWQYIASGELSNLEALSMVLNFIKTSNLDIAHLMTTTPIEDVKEQLISIVSGVLNKVEEKRIQQGGHLTLARGYATIPLRGLDVPFHSSFLLSGVTPFRSYLSKRISPSFINVNLL
ncbi:fatty acid synthase alpha subunit Lsd1, partial [Dimargaris xerosporica]